MKKEIENKLSEFIRRESNLIVAINANPSDSKARTDMLKLRHEITEWLGELGGSKTLSRPEDCAALDVLMRNATIDISHTAKINSQLVEYIQSAAREGGDAWARYEKIVEDFSQLEALSQAKAEKAIKALQKFNKKVNGKSFLNVLMCKFRKSKAQENANENQGPSVQ